MNVYENHQKGGPKKEGEKKTESEENLEEEEGCTIGVFRKLVDQTRG